MNYDICFMNYKEFFKFTFNKWYVIGENGKYIFTRRSDAISYTYRGHFEQFQYEIDFKEVEGKKGTIYLLNDFYYTTIDEVLEELYKIGIK